jgi:uncharacterized damage-inducible protein DinB
MNQRAKLLADAMNGSREWTLRLIADLTGDDWTYQPKPGLHHCLWLCGHLACAESLLILVRCAGQNDPNAAFSRHFQIGKPISDAKSGDFPSHDAVVETMAATHLAVMAVIQEMDDEVLDQPCFGKDGAIHPHYRTNAEAIVHAVRHEGFHAGQIAMIRRLLGKTFLR